MHRPSLAVAPSSGYTDSVAQPLSIEEALAMARDLAQSGDLANAAGICARILKVAPGQPQALHLLGMAALQQGQASEAVELLRRAIRSDPHFVAALNDLANLLLQQGALAEADACYRRAIAAAPDFAGAHNNLGNLLQMTNSLEEAVACYRTAVGLRPGYAEAFRNLGSALRRLGRPEEAARALRTAMGINPGFAAAIAQLAHQLKELCDWSQLDGLTAELREIVETGSAAVNPFVFLSLDTTPREQLLCARRWAAEHVGPPRERAVVPKVDDRITIGYLSADFQEHATTHLIAELFRLHDRRRFRVIGYSYGRDDGTAARRQLRESFPRRVRRQDRSWQGGHPGGSEGVHHRCAARDTRPAASAGPGELPGLSGQHGERRSGLHFGGSSGGSGGRAAVLHRTTRAPSGMLPGERPPPADRAARPLAAGVRAAGSRVRVLLP